MNGRVSRVSRIVVPGGLRLRARAWDDRSRSGTPLVLLHGLLDSSEGWAGVAATTSRPCFAFDLPGFGGSDLPARKDAIAYAEAVCAGIERHVDGPCVLVGHSLGGLVASHVAERCDQVAGLGLLAPAGYGRIPLADRVTRPGVLQAAEVVLPFALASRSVVTAAYLAFVARNTLPEPELVERLRSRALHATPGVRAAAEAIALAGRSPDALHRRPLRFGGPVAALWGERDALVPRAHVRALRRSVPHAHVEVWPGMGHHPQRERPRQLAHFLERHATRCTAERLASVPLRAAA